MRAMIVAERRLDGSRRIVSELAQEFDGLKLEIISRLPEAADGEGTVEAKLFDSQTGEELACYRYGAIRSSTIDNQFGIELFSQESVGPEVLFVDPAMEADGLYAGTKTRLIKMNVEEAITDLVVYGFHEAGAAVVVVDEERCLSPEASEFTERVEGWLGKSRMAEFYDSGELGLKGGLIVKIVESQEVAETGRGSLYCNLLSPDGLEGYLDFLIKQDEEGTVCFIEQGCDKTRLLMANRQAAESENNQAVDEAIRRVVGRVNLRREVNAKDNLMEALLLLSHRYVWQKFGEVRLIDGRTGNVEEVVIDKDRLAMVTEEWLDF